MLLYRSREGGEHSAIDPCGSSIVLQLCKPAVHAACSSFVMIAFWRVAQCMCMRTSNALASRLLVPAAPPARIHPTVRGLGERHIHALACVQNASAVVKW